MKPKIAVGLLVAVLALWAGSLALGGSRYETKVSISYSRSSGGYFAGKVRSHGGCVAGRVVAVYRKRPGSDPAVGKDTTRSNGRWRVAPSQIATGEYYAKTPAVRLGGGAGTCAGAKSATTRAS